MNANNNSSYTNYPAPQQSSNKSKIILIIVIAAVVILLAALGTYAALASTNNWWPFATSTNKSATENKPSLTIKKVAVKEVNGKQMLDIALKLESQDKGYCVVTVSSKIARLEIDDSKVKTQPKDAVPLKPCQGWSIDASNLPKGEYTIDVKFVGQKSKLSASDKVTLKNDTTSN